MEPLAVMMVGRNVFNLLRTPVYLNNANGTKEVYTTRFYKHVMKDAFQHSKNKFGRTFAVDENDEIYDVTGDDNITFDHVCSSTS